MKKIINFKYKNSIDKLYLNGIYKQKCKYVGYCNNHINKIIICGCPIEFLYEYSCINIVHDNYHPNVLEEINQLIVTQIKIY